jgi:hypothetical protein
MSKLGIAALAIAVALVAFAATGATMKIGNVKIAPTTAAVADINNSLGIAGCVNVTCPTVCIDEMRYYNGRCVNGGCKWNFEMCRYGCKPEGCEDPCVNVTCPDTCVGKLHGFNGTCSGGGCAYKFENCTVTCSDGKCV